MDDGPGDALRAAPSTTVTARIGRVLFVDNSSTFGGAIESLAHLTAGLAQRGFEPVVVSGQPAERLDDAFPHAETQSVDVRVRWRDRTAPYRLARRMPDGNPMTRGLLGLAAVDWHLRRTVPQAVRYARIGAAHDVDLVHLNNNIEGQLEALLAAKLLGVPCVAHAQGFQQPTRALRMIVAQVDHHVAISGAIRENLMEIGAPADDITVVHHGMDVEKFAAPRDTESAREELGVPPNAPVFALFGRVIEWKGVREFVLAAERVLQGRDDARALVVGDESDGSADYFREVRRMAEASDVGDRILFTGYRDDVPTLMQMVDAVVHTSIEPEPFGMVIAEAMGAGRPVVAADAGGPLDIVEEGETGYRVDPRDTEALASAIGRLLDDPERAEEMGEAGRRRAARLFNKDRFARNVASVYERLET